MGVKDLVVDSPFFSTMVLFKNLGPGKMKTVRRLWATVRLRTYPTGESAFDRASVHFANADSLGNNLDAVSVDLPL